MRKTKIVCTIGPACETEEIMSAMVDAGMNVARFNFSHGSHEYHQQLMDTLKKVREKKDAPIAIMLDTKGPEYRIGKFAEGSCIINKGDTFTFTADDVLGDNTKVSVSYKDLAKDLEVGDKVLVNNGILIFAVKEIVGNDVVCVVEAGGEIKDRKSMSFPGKVLNQEYLSEQDKSDLLLGIKNEVDFIACSFVSTKQDVIDVIDFLKENNAPNIGIIAKIENESGIENIEDICSVCDGIMIGRGDMGVELPFEQLPSIQKKLITKCRLLGKRVITATEMLESMITNPRPTRAETSDVANAVYDGTSALMLSGETAAGNYPVLTVETMSKIAEATESTIQYHKRFIETDYRTNSNVDAVSHSVCGMAMDVDAKTIVACSISGKTARMISRFRPPVDIIGLTVEKRTWYQLALSWGVIPFMCEMYPSIEVLFFTAKKVAEYVLKLKSGDKIIITGGTTAKSGTTNTIRYEEIE